MFCISLLLLCAGFLVKGVFISVDTDDFLSAGQRFIEGIPAGAAGLEEIRNHTLFPHYLISSMLMSGIYWYLDGGAVGVVIFNATLFSLIVCMMFSIWGMVCGDRDWRWRNGFFVVGTGGGFYIMFGLPDVFLWSYAVLTDTIFLFWVAAFVFCIVKGLLEKGRLMWSLAFLLCVTAPFVRPTGMVMPLLYLFALSLKCVPAMRSHFKTAFAASMLVPVALVLIVVPWLVLTAVNDPAAVDELIPDAMKGHFLQSVHFFKEGVIISNRFEVDYGGPLSYLDIVKTICYRLGYYWVPVRLGETPYSVIHNIVNSVYILAGWPLVAAGARSLLRAGKERGLVLLFLAMVATGYALLHSVTLVSFDWRYQLPGMVPFWVVAGCGFYSLLRYVTRIHADRKPGKRTAETRVPG